MRTAAHKFGALAISASFFFGAVNIASAQAQHRGGQVTIPASSTQRSGDIGLRAHTNIKLFTPTGGLPRASAAASLGPPFSGYLFETPGSLACIYNLIPEAAGCNPNTVTAVSTGGSGAIAIVDAYDDPGAARDLAKFSRQFRLPPARFQVVFATGSRPFNDPGWEIEESLDVQWAHAMAPTAKLYLVEAASNSFEDLLTAETVAASIVANDGGGVVSNSCGWYIVGGTSASSPIWAGIISAAGNNSGSTVAELTAIYKNRGNKEHFNDVNSGVCGPWNGNLAQAGYDLCTGVGSPVGYGAK